MSETTVPPVAGAGGATGEVLLRLDGVSAGYDGITVVRDLSLEVRAGEVVALLGPNGAGKTTTLGAISGLVERHGGTIEVVGGEVPKLRKAHLLPRRGLLHVPESRGIFPGLTVRENLVLAKRRGRVDVSDLGDLFPQLPALMDRRAGLCSGGEQQMISMARALLADPRLLMVDEMSLGLAPLVVESLMAVVRRVADELSLGVLLVEQYVELTLTIADRATVLTHGEQVLEGSAEELRKNRVAVDSAYLGS